MLGVLTERSWLLGSLHCELVTKHTSPATQVKHLFQSLSTHQQAHRGRTTHTQEVAYLRISTTFPKVGTSESTTTHTSSGELVRTASGTQASEYISVACLYACQFVGRHSPPVLCRIFHRATKTKRPSTADQVGTNRPIGPARQRKSSRYMSPSGVSMMKESAEWFAM